MTKKSASQFKVVKNQEAEKQADPKEQFEQYVKVEKELIKTQLGIVDRVDSYVDVKEEAESFFGSRKVVGIEDLEEFVGELKKAFEDVSKVIDSYDYEWASSPEYEDPYEKMLDIHVHSATMYDLFVQHLRFKAIRPYGDRALKLYCMVQEQLPQE